MTGSYEVGLEMKFFNGRLGLDATYYNQNSKDQILSLASTTTSGYAYRLINAGEIQNQGVEIALNARALQIKDFAWDYGCQLLEEYQQGEVARRWHGLFRVG